MLNIFLDLDGVLVTKRCTKTWTKIALPYGEYKYENLCWDETAVYQFTRFLGDIKKHTELQIILSSDWRWANPEESNRELFARYEIPQYVSATPVREPETHGIRGKEILWWIKHNNAEGQPYLVIDDLDVRKDIPKEHIVFVQGGWHSGGFNKWHYRHALTKAQLQLGLEPTYPF